MAQPFLSMEDFFAAMAEIKEQQRQTAEQQRETAEQQRQTSEQQRETSEQQRETSEQMKKTDEQIRKNEEKLARMGIYLGGISNNNGDVAEEFFFSSLSKKPQLGSIRFDDISPNVIKLRQKKEEEYDILMTNGNVIAIVEVKWKFHPEDLKKLDRKVEHFKEFFPIYKDFKVYGAIAGMSVPRNTEKEALEKGYFVLKQVGNHMEVEEAKNLRVL